MDNDIEQKIKEQFEKLPAVVQQAIQSSNFETTLQAIGAKQGLHIDQVGDLQDETLLVMMGLSDPGEFAARLEERMHLDPQKAAAVAEAVGTEVFMPIRTSMREFMEKQESDAAAELVKKTVQTPPTPEPKAKPDFSAADSMLQTKTVSTPTPTSPLATKGTAPAPSEALAKEGPKPTNYAADPYREPPM